MLRMKRSMAEKPQWVRTEPIQAVAADWGANRGGRGYKAPPQTFLKQYNDVNTAHLFLELQSSSSGVC